MVKFNFYKDNDYYLAILLLLFYFFNFCFFISRWLPVKTMVFYCIRKIMTPWHWSCTRDTYDLSMTSPTTHPPLYIGMTHTYIQRERRVLYFLSLHILFYKNHVNGLNMGLVLQSKRNAH